MKTTMSVNHKKLVTYLKEQLGKAGNDKSAVMLKLNRELVNVKEKMLEVTSNQPAIEKQLRKYLDMSSITKYQYEMRKGSKILASGISELPKKLHDLRLMFSQKNAVEGEEGQAKWKLKKNIVSDLSIHARTKYIVSSIVTAQSENSKAQRLETLVDHFKQYPEGISIAAKQGAISKLISVRDNSSEQVVEVVREALAILGYSDPLPMQGIRILAIDGGGIRGLMVMEMLKKLEELTGNKVCDLFDYICGVSTGSVIACTTGASGKSIKEVMNLYTTLSCKIFNQNVFFGTRSLLQNHGYYDTALWESVLKEHVGMQQLISTTRRKGCPRIGVLSAVSEDNRLMPFIFRNYELPYKIKSRYLGSCKHQLWEAVRASAAAPTYFEEFRLGEFLHQDGGILVNNPTAVAIYEARRLWPNRPIQCVVSFGTGRTNINLGNLKKDDEKKAAPKQTSWKKKFSYILGSATDTEAIHLIVNDLIHPSVYFRFNPYVMELVSMDEHQPEKLAALQNDTLMYIRRNEEKFQEAAKALLMKKNVYQKVTDWAREKAVKYVHRS